MEVVTVRLPLTTFFVLLMFVSPFFLDFAVPALPAEELIKSDGKRKTELWEGRVLTARFRVGMCFEPGGDVRGVLILKHLNGNEDTYHLYGKLKGDNFDLSHSSGHYFNGQLTGPDSMEGKVKLSNGMKMTLKGSRTRNVTLKAPDCAPLK